jgi:PncC family amidohydrolase
MKDIVNYLIDNNLTISTMESCTGGELASSITSIPDASKVISFSAVTYSNEFKIKMGVDPELIDKYSVYSMEVAKDMSKKISIYTGSTFGVGITGKFNKKDENNPFGNDSIVFISIYDSRSNTYLVKELEVVKLNRKDNKKEVIDAFEEMFKIKYNI